MDHTINWNSPVEIRGNLLTGSVNGVPVSDYLTVDGKTETEGLNFTSPVTVGNLVMAEGTTISGVDLHRLVKECVHRDSRDLITGRKVRKDGFFFTS